MIKAVIFDYGNVIHKWDNDIFLKEFVKLSCMDYSHVVDVIFGQGLHDKLETGEISDIAFFKTIKDQLNLKISQDEFFRLFSSKLFKKIETTISLIKKLKKIIRLHYFQIQTK